MPRVQCPECNSTLKVAAEYEGRRGVCPCGARFRIRFDTSHGYSVRVEDKSLQAGPAERLGENSELSEDDSFETLESAPDLSDASFYLRIREWLAERSKLELCLLFDGAGAVLLGVFLSVCLFNIGMANTSLVVGWSAPWDYIGLSDILPTSDDGMSFVIPPRTVAFSALYAFSAPLIALGLVLGRNAEFSDWMRAGGAVLLLGFPLMTPLALPGSRIVLLIAAIAIVFAGLTAASLEQYRVKNMKQAIRWSSYSVLSAIAGLTLIATAFGPDSELRNWISPAHGRSTLSTMSIYVAVILFVRATVAFWTHTWYLSHSKNENHREIASPVYKSVMFTFIAVAGILGVALSGTDWFASLSLQAAVLISTTAAAATAWRLLA